MRGWKVDSAGICTRDIQEGVNNVEDLVINSKFALYHTPRIENYIVVKYVAHIGAKTTNAKDVLISGASMEKPSSYYDINAWERLMGLGGSWESLCSLLWEVK